MHPLCKKPELGSCRLEIYRGLPPPHQRSSQERRIILCCRTWVKRHFYLTGKIVAPSPKTAESARSAMCGSPIIVQIFAASATVAVVESYSWNGIQGCLRGRLFAKQRLAFGRAHGCGFLAGRDDMLDPVAAVFLGSVEPGIGLTQ